MEWGFCSRPPPLSLYLTLRASHTLFYPDDIFSRQEVAPFYRQRNPRFPEAPQLVSGRAFKIAFALWKLNFTQPPGDRAFQEQTYHCEVGFQPPSFPLGPSSRHRGVGRLLKAGGRPQPVPPGPQRLEVGACAVRRKLCMFSCPSKAPLSPRPSGPLPPLLESGEAGAAQPLAVSVFGDELSWLESFFPF